MKTEKFDQQPVVIGAPRTGFSLLINIIAKLLPFSDFVANRQSSILRAFVTSAGPHIADAIIQKAQQLGIDKDLVYSPNFQYVIGGPRWVSPDDRSMVCFRKYFGVIGHGDFTLITRHPIQLLNSQDIIHTHSNPEYWAKYPDAQSRFLLLTSQRNPVDTLYSSCFSLNALSSEYIQHYMPPEQDNDGLREILALYKLTDLKFFTGLISSLKNYLEEFIEVRDHFQYIMRWEDLLVYPAHTIVRIAAAMGYHLDEKSADRIWGSICWRNLTDHHKHNYRRGHGIVGGWRRYLVNEHLSLMRDNGLDRLSQALGYGDIYDLEPSDYTSYQNKVAQMISRGEIYRNYSDPWLFEFAFNKSNLATDAFEFKHYGWREHTQIERSSMNDEDIVMEIWDTAELATARFNKALTDLLTLSCSERLPTRIDLERFVRVHSSIFNRPESQTIAVFESAWTGQPCDPQLLKTVGSFNIVRFGSTYYGLPKSIGKIDFFFTDPTGMPGVIKADSLEAVEAALSEDNCFG